MQNVEQSRRWPDAVLVSLLKLIGDDPERAARLLASPPPPPPEVDAVKQG